MSVMCTRAARRGTRHALLVADMPYGSYHHDPAEAVRNAVRFVKEAGAEAVKLEGGERRMELIARMVEAEIPVMGHIGLTPQSVNAFGGFRVQGKTEEAGEQLLRDARAVEAAGAFAIVLESIPRELAARITAKLKIPTIGIGAGPDCDGQVLVIHDLVGLSFGHKPKFTRRYANVGEIISRAAADYCRDVQHGSFPSDEESYHARPERTGALFGCRANDHASQQSCNRIHAGGFSMVTPELLRFLFQYNSWADRRLLDTCSALSNEQFTRNLGSSFSSVRDTVTHLYGAEWVWNERFQGRSPTALVSGAGYPDLLRPFARSWRKWISTTLIMSRS